MLDSSCLAGAPVLHVSLAVADVEAASRFLVACFGYRERFREVGMTGQIRAMTGDATLACDIAQLERGGGDPIVELIAYHGAIDVAGLLPGRGAGGSHLAFEVGDLDAARGEVARHDAREVGVVTRFSDCDAVYCVAPGGLIFELEQPLAEA